MLFEQCERGWWIGHTGNYLRAAAKSDENLTNRIGRVVVETADGVLSARVEARYRFVVQPESVSEGDGTAELVWSKGEEGWQISSAVLRMAEGATLPTGWK